MAIAALPVHGTTGTRSKDIVASSANDSTSDVKSPAATLRLNRATWFATSRLTSIWTPLARGLRDRRRHVPRQQLLPSRPAPVVAPAHEGGELVEEVHRHEQREHRRHILPRCDDRAVSAQDYPYHSS